MTCWKPPVFRHDEVMVKKGIPRSWIKKNIPDYILGSFSSLNWGFEHCSGGRGLLQDGRSPATLNISTRQNRYFTKHISRVQESGDFGRTLWTL